MQQLCKSLTVQKRRNLWHLEINKITLTAVSNNKGGQLEVSQIRGEGQVRQEYIFLFIDMW